MCGRYTITATGEQLIERFDAELEADFEPRYNAAPTQNLPVILSDAPHKIRLVRWGLLPKWVREQKRDGIINVRTETLAEKPTFKKDLRERRCLVISDGFYEWQQTDKGKVPYRFTLKDGKPFVFAGIWEPHHINDQEVNTFAIITTTPNSIVEKVHNRMPVILRTETEREWLNPDLEPEQALGLLAPYPASQMQAYPVSTLVNLPRNDSVEVIKPA